MNKRASLHQGVTVGDKLADKITGVVGSWSFILTQSFLLITWITLNSLALFVWKWDPAPFILLNLCLSFQAAYTAPIIMMSQNRQATKDRQRDDLEAEEVKTILDNHAETLSISRQLLTMQSQQMQILRDIKIIQAAIQTGEEGI